MNRNLKWVSRLQPVGQIQLPVFVNKLLLAQSHAHLFTYVSGCLHARTVVLNSPRRNHRANVAENISYLASCRKSMLVPDLKERILEVLVSCLYPSSD